MNVRPMKKRLCLAKCFTKMLCASLSASRAFIVGVSSITITAVDWCYRLVVVSPQNMYLSTVDAGKRVQKLRIQLPAYTAYNIYLDRETFVLRYLTTLLLLLVFLRAI